MKLSSITLTKAQREVLALDIKGDFIILGVAGSGKSVTALFRGIQLSNTSADSKVLIITFNQALKKYLSHLLTQYISDQGESVCNRDKIIISTYHEFAKDYLGESVKMISSHWQNKYIEEAIEKARLGISDGYDLRKITVIIKKEISTIQDFGLTTASSYKNKSSNNVTDDESEIIYSIYQKYIEIRKANNYDCDLSDVSTYVFEQLSTKPSGYTHIVLDEGQDLSPNMIKSLVNAKSELGSFNYFGDVSQQIYRDISSWQECFIPDTAQIVTLEQNYRNTPEIVNFAKEIIKSANWKLNEYTLDSKINMANGMKPILKKFSTKEEETQWVIENIKYTNNGASTNLVVFSTNKEVTSFIAILKENDINAVKLNKNSEECNFDRLDAVNVSTYHTSKGLEFDNVYIPYLIEPETTETLNQSELFLQLKLLYVVITRSKSGLIMSCHNKPSNLLPLHSQYLQIIE